LSRTDAHAPFHVRIARGDITASPRHARIHDACDLPDQEATEPYPWRRTTGCVWEFFYTGVSECPCPNCHGGWQARANNRAERHRDHAALRQALDTWRGGDSAAFDALLFPSRR
jgi:hypothetical protein